MVVPINTPQEAFVRWFDELPRTLGEVLARWFYLCTTEDTSQMVLGAEEYWGNFRYFVVKADFPLRIAARMFYIRSVFDMVIFHHEEILTESRLLSHGKEKDKEVSLLSEKQWERVLASWAKLRGQEMSENYIHSWTSWVIKQQHKS